MELDPVILADVTNRAKGIKSDGDEVVSEMDGFTDVVDVSLSKVNNIHDIVQQAGIGSDTSKEDVSEVVGKIAGIKSLLSRFSNAVNAEVDDVKRVVNSAPVLIDSQGTWLRSGKVDFNVGDYPDASTALIVEPDHPLTQISWEDGSDNIAINDDFLFEVYISEVPYINVYDLKTGSKIHDSVELRAGPNAEDSVPDTVIRRLVYLYDRLEFHCSGNRYYIDLDTFKTHHLPGTLGILSSGVMLEHPLGVVMVDTTRDEIVLINKELTEEVKFPQHDTHRVKVPQTYYYNNANLNLYKINGLYVDNYGNSYDENFNRNWNATTLDGITGSDNCISNGKMVVQFSSGGITKVRRFAVGSMYEDSRSDRAMYIKVK